MQRENEIQRGIFCVVSRFPLHFMLPVLRGDFVYFLDSVGQCVALFFQYKDINFGTSLKSPKACILKKKNQKRLQRRVNTSLYMNIVCSTVRACLLISRVQMTGTNTF